MIWEKLKKLTPILLILSGLGLIAVALAADYLFGNGYLDFGVKQKTAVLMGAVILCMGVFLITPHGQRFVNYLSSPPETYKQPISIFLMVLWFGLLSGYGEIIIREYRKIFLGKILLLNHHMVWMIPIGAVAEMFIFGLVLTIGSRRWPILSSVRIVTFVFLSLGISSWLLLFSGLYDLAALLLAFGFAFQMSRFMAFRPDRLSYLMNKSLVWMGIVTIILGISVIGWKTLNEQRQLQNLVMAPKGAPNVLFITMDTVRAESLSLYGYERNTTPSLKAWATEGALFKWAVSAAPWTLPSHASMFTGHYPHELSADWTSPLDSTYPTLAEVLLDHGYQTAGFIANLDYCNSAYGLNRGFIQYEDVPVSPGQLVLSLSLGRTISNLGVVRKLFGYHDILNRKNAEEINSSFLDLLARRDQ